MQIEWTLVIKFLALVGGVAVSIAAIWKAYIRRHDKKLLVLRDDPDGARTLVMRGYSHSETKLLAKQIAGAISPVRSSDQLPPVPRLHSDGRFKRR